MLTACERAAMAECVEGTFDKTVEILENQGAEETDTGGEGVPDWQIAATVSGQVLPVTSPGDRAEGGRQVDDERRLIRLSLGTAVTSANRLRIGSLTYEVLAVLNDQSFPVSIDCQCKRLA